MYNSLNLVVPLLTTDIVLKIRNNTGKITYIIKDPTCTIKIDGNILSCKQQSESSYITLDFVSAEDARLGHVVLRNALIQLSSNLGLVDNKVLTYNFVPSITTVTGIDSVISLPIAAISIDSVFVNEGYVSNISNSQYSFTQGSPGNINFTWKGTAMYILEPSDIVTIKYYNQ